MKVYGIIFKDGNKTYNFKSELTLKKDDKVIVDTDKGLQYAKVSKIIDSDENVEALKEIVRIATKDDDDQFLENLKEADKALKKCRRLVEELQLNMNVLNAQFTFERTQLLFNFIADDRIDFRDFRIQGGLSC